MRHRVVRRAVYRPQPAAAIDPVRNIILCIGSGYQTSQWDTVRAARADGLLAVDRMPVTAAALPPDRAAVDASRLAWWIGTGASGFVDPLPPTITMLARQAGRSVALVSGGDVTDPLPAFLSAPSAGGPGTATLQRLVSSRVDALFARSAPTDAGPSPATYGYHVLTDPQAVLMGEALPVLATASRETMPFDALAFRALHLAARNPRGFVLALGASQDTVAPDEFNAALNMLRGYAKRDKRTLMVVVLCGDAGPCALYADGMASHKFGGTLYLTDIPKIAAGVAAIKGMTRDFSPLYQPRLAAQAPVVPRGRGLVPLPW